MNIVYKLTVIYIFFTLDVTFIICICILSAITFRIFLFFFLFKHIIFRMCYWFCFNGFTFDSIFTENRREVTIINCSVIQCSRDMLILLACFRTRLI
ncbi:Os07g0217800 [Oryza sativa Japonica Group]|uniref:Os07g0217800 protein n=1 Tax=Oryza sativa subsp. japonica TaxID=39947 RepID=Q0D7R5_ORYSJ|nr:Os07g0217800 [Oryza sativa Japonica Group]|eukprot:NP_001059194.1 Os07g0217800 [Oryza sativa Japonica Group]